jgi:hypothetical protein
LASRSIDVLSDNPGGQKLELLHETLQKVINEFLSIVTKIENSWIASDMSVPAQKTGECCSTPTVMES